MESWSVFGPANTARSSLTISVRSPCRRSVTQRRTREPGLLPWMSCGGHRTPDSGRFDEAGSAFARRCVTSWPGSARRTSHRMTPCYGLSPSSENGTSVARCSPVGSRQFASGALRPRPASIQSTLPAQRPDREARRTRSKAPSGDQKGFVQGGTGPVARDPEGRPRPIEMESDSGLSGRVRRTGALQLSITVHFP